jgi:oligosaccharide translocation protein RFT1
MVAAATDGVQGKALKGMSMMVLVSGVQKIITFLLNSALVRRTHPGIFGVAAVQLELLLSTLLFFSREGVRLALLREESVGGDATKRQQFINMSWIPACILACATLLVCGVWIVEAHTTFSLSWLQFKDVSITVMLLYCLGALFESCGEPWINVYQNNLNFAPKLGAETLALCVRSIVTFVCLVKLDVGVLGFGFAQLGYGLTHFAVVVSSSGIVQQQQHQDGCGSSGKVVSLGWSDYLPRKAITPRTVAGGEKKKGKKAGGRANEQLAGESMVDATALGFAVSATGSSLLKHVLTEADKITLSLTRSSFEQGIFAIANNYASLIARLAFAPVEESARAAFAKYAQSLKRLTSTTTTTTTSKGNGNGNERRRVLLEMLAFLSRLLQAVTVVGTLLLAFGPSYVRLAVDLYLAPQWREEETVRTLAVFCLYIFMLGLNGVSEAFLYSVADGFAGINVTLGTSTAVYVAVNTAILRLAPGAGTAGIVLSGSAAYLVRVAINFHNIAAYFSASGVPVRVHVLVGRLIPGVWLSCALAAASAVCWESSVRYTASTTGIEEGGRDWRAALVHVMVGAAMLVFVLVVAYASTTKQEIQDLLSIVRRTKKQGASESEALTVPLPPKKEEEKQQSGGKVKRAAKSKSPRRGTRKR